MSDGRRAVDSDKVWTTLITNLDYLPGLLTLNHSLIKSGSRYPLVALYTDTFPRDGLAALECRGIPAQRIEYLLPTKGKDYSNDPRFYDCWSKLMSFSLTQYKRVVQLDSDMLVLRNMDELMDLELDDGDFAAENTPGAAIGSPKWRAEAKAAAAAAAEAAISVQVNGEARVNGEKINGVVNGHAATNGNGHSTINGHIPTTTTNADDHINEGEDEFAVKNPSTRVFAAGHACVCNPLKKPHYPRDWTPENCAFTTQHATPEEAQTVGPDPVTASPLGFMNGGLQVVNPSGRLFRQIVEHMERGAMDMDFADQSVLSELYRGRWVPLPYVYNALKTMRWPGVHGDIWRDDEVRNVHYILAPKPWDEIDADGNWTGTEESHRWWADFNSERRKLEKVAGVHDGF